MFNDSFSLNYFKMWGFLVFVMSQKSYFKQTEQNLSTFSLY